MIATSKLQTELGLGEYILNSNMFPKLDVGGWWSKTQMEKHHQWADKNVILFTGFVWKTAGICNVLDVSFLNVQVW